MGNEFKKASTEKRILAAFIDYCILAFPLSSIFVWYSFRHFHVPSQSTYHVFFLVVMILLVCLCFRDVFGGASLGKRTVGLIVGNHNKDTEAVSSVGKLILRNIPGIIWIVELIVLVSSKDNRRIGDKVTGTDVYIAAERIRPVVMIVTIILLMCIFMGVMIVSVFSMSINP